MSWSVPVVPPCFQVLTGLVRPASVAGVGAASAGPIICVREGVQDLVELALNHQFFPGLGVLDDEHHGQGERGHQRLKDRVEARREPEHSAHGDPHDVSGHEQQRDQRSR